MPRGKRKAADTKVKKRTRREISVTIERREDTDSPVAGGVGSSIPYEVKGEQVAVPYASLYSYRGKALEHLSRLEYYCLTKVVKVHATSSTADKRGRPLSKRFPFSPDCPIYGEYG